MHLFSEFFNFRSPYLIKAIFGVHNLSNYTPDQAIEVKYYIVHRNWSSETVQNDIALLKLSKNVTLSSTIQTVKLPNDTYNYTGQEAVLIGWGKTENGTISNVLKSVNSSIISNQECNNTYGVSIQKVTYTMKIVLFQNLLEIFLLLR